MSSASTDCIYRCANKKCGKYHKEFVASSPAVFRRATGGFIRCVQCGEVVWYVRRASN